MAARRCLYAPPLVTGIHFECTATHTREIFGRREYRLLPAAGTGSIWATESVITWKEEGTP